MIDCQIQLWALQISCRLGWAGQPRVYTNGPSHPDQASTFRPRGPKCDDLFVLITCLARCPRSLSQDMMPSNIAVIFERKSHYMSLGFSEDEYEELASDEEIDTLI